MNYLPITTREPTTTNQNQLISITLILMALFLHQSNVIFGVNISFADILCVIILTLLIFSNQLIFPVTPTLFFLVISLIVLLTAVIYIPLVLLQDTNPIRITSDYIKLVAIFIYFVIGYNLVHLKLVNNTIKWYSIFGLIIGGIGFIATVLNSQVFSDILFFAGVRLRGLMIDPNYFSILQITALVYFIREKKLNKRLKWTALTVIFLSILAAGSKTGLITLFIYLAFVIFETLMKGEKSLKNVVVYLFSLVFIILLTPLIIPLFQTVMTSLGGAIPSLDRVLFIFTDFGDAFSGSGSARETTWLVALNVVLLSPVLGIGVGTYTDIANEFFNYNNVAHNTFLQLSAEWGIPLAFLFFTYVFIHLGKVTFRSSSSTNTNLMLRDIILILLIGSLAITLSNARVFWLIFGVLASSLKREEVEKIPILHRQQASQST